MAHSSCSTLYTVHILLAHVVLLCLFFPMHIPWYMNNNWVGLKMNILYNVPQNSKIFPEFNFPFHQIFSYQTGAVTFIFSCIKNVCCSRTHTVNQQIIIFHFFKQLWDPPFSHYNNHAMTSYIPSLKPTNCVSRRRHCTSSRITLTQASIRSC